MKQIVRKEIKDFGPDYGATMDTVLGNSANANNGDCPSFTSDAKWLRGLMNISMGGNVTEFQPDTAQNAPCPEKRMQENYSPPSQTHKNLSSLSDIKNRLLHNREVLLKKENIILLSHLEDLNKQEMAHKAERHRAQLAHEAKLNEAQLNKLAMEAKLLESQLNKVALESRQLEAQQAREAESHGVRLTRETELHQARLAREAELHAALLAREVAGTILAHDKLACAGKEWMKLELMHAMTKSCD